MKINTKLRYGLRMLLALGQEPDAVKSTSELGKSMLVSPKYLRKLAGPMEKHGLIKSVQGIYGGYKLNQPADQITILKLVEAFDEKIQLSHCFNDKKCPLFDECMSRPLWDYLVKLIESRFASTTLSDILNRTFEN